jgi:hypothetical protein
MIPEGIGDSVLGAWLTLRLVKGLVDLSGRHAVDHWYSFMEGGFFRLLRRLGLRFQPTGGAFEFHGRRFLSLDSVDQLLADMQAAQPGLFARMGFSRREVAPALSGPVACDRPVPHRERKAPAVGALAWADDDTRLDCRALVGA